LQMAHVFDPFHFTFRKKTSLDDQDAFLYPLNWVLSETYKRVERTQIRANFR
jgi:hypothetical protein